MTYKEKVNEKCDGVEADEVLTKIATKLAPNVHYSLTNFTNALSKDETFMPYGELKHSFSVNGIFIIFCHFSVLTFFTYVCKIYLF